MLFDLYKNLDKYEYTLTLCKPNKEEMVILSEAYDINYQAKFGDVDELSFKIPSKVQDTVSHIYVDNPNYDLIKGDFLIHMQTQLVEKYFIIDTPKEAEGERDIKDIQCVSLENELGKKNIRSFKGTRQIYKRPEDVIETGEGILNLLEEQTTWKVGYVDPLVYEERTYLYEEARFITSFNPTERVSIHRKYRTFDVVEDNWMNFIRSEIEPAFDCIFLFDTVNRKVNVYHIDTLSQDRGLFISKDNFLKNINIEPKFSEIYTRIRVYGKDNISINSVNPLGTDYLENFDYYMDNGYMSESLVNALTTYNSLMSAKGSDFRVLLDSLSVKQEALLQLQTEMSTLLSEKIILLDTKDSQIMQGADLTSINTLIVAKEQQIAEKQVQIDSCNADITGIQNDIIALRDVIDKKNNFTSEQLTELDYFIKEKSWQNNNYDDVDALYEAGKQALKKLTQPTLSYSMDIADLLDMVECKLEWDKVINLGNIMTIETRKGLIQQRIVGYTHSVGKSLSVACSNKDRLDSPERYLTDSIGQAIVSGKTMYIQKSMWDKAESTEMTLNDWMNSALDASRNAIIGGRNQAVRIDERGLGLFDMTNPNEQLRAINNCLAMTVDNWETASLAITPYGIIAQKIIGELLLGEKLKIRDESGTFDIVGNLLTVRDNLNKIRVRLGEYEPGKYGLELRNSTGDQVILSQDGIAQSYGFEVADNVDSTHGLKLKFYIPDNTLSVRSIKLAFSLEKFRSYEKAIIGGSSSKLTSDSGGGETTYNSQSWGSGWGYDNTMGDYVYNAEVYSLISGQQYAAVGRSAFSHIHDTKTHSHGMAHTHDSTIEHGIYEGTVADGINIYVDGVYRNGSYYSDATNIELAEWITTPGFHEIILTSTQLGRINASIFISCFTAM